MSAAMSDARELSPVASAQLVRVLAFGGALPPSGRSLVAFFAFSPGFGFFFPGFQPAFSAALPRSNISFTCRLSFSSSPP